MTQDYNIFEESWFDTYREMMTIFLKQGGFVTEVSMQVSGDDLHLTLIGQKGNMLYMRLGDFFLGKTKPAISGDYVVRARSVLDATSFGIILVHGYYPLNWETKGHEWNKAIHQAADLGRPIWWLRYRWFDCPEKSVCSIFLSRSFISSTCARDSNKSLKLNIVLRVSPV